MRSWWRIATLVTVVLSACGGGTSDSAGTSSGSNVSDVVVESTNGLATLTLPPGSLPADVSAGDVNLEAIVIDSAVPGAPVIVVQLLPDGLALDEPATLTVALPETLDGVFMAIHVSGDTIEFLEGVVEWPDDVPTFVTSVTHFSDVTFHYVDVATGSISLTPMEVSKGQIQKADVTFSMKSDPFNVLISFDSDPDGTSRLFVFSAPMPPFRFDNPRVIWDFFPGVWDLPRVPVDLSKSDTGWKADASSTCVRENQGPVTFGPGVRFSMELLAAGEPTESDFMTFAAAATTLTGEGIGRAGGEVALLDSSPGDIIEAKGTVSLRAPTVCSAAGSTPPPTGSETAGGDEELFDVQIGQHPWSHITGITPTSTSNNTLGLVVSFAQPWDTLPPSLLRSFFIWLSVVGQDVVGQDEGCAVEGGWQLHEGVVSNLGPMPMSIVNDGTVFFDTGCSLEPGGLILVNTRAGSWASDAENAVFRENVEFLVDADKPVAPMEGQCLVFNLTDLTPLQECEQW